MLGQALRFAAVGLANTGVSLAAIYAVMFMPGASPALANAIGYAIGLALSFGLNRAWTFGCKERAAVLLPGYLLAVALCYALNLAAVMSAISYLDMNPYLAQLLGVAVYTPSLFALSRRLVFRPPGRTATFAKAHQHVPAPTHARVLDIATRPISAQLWTADAPNPAQPANDLAQPADNQLRPVDAHVVRARA